jgi:hypothetical protein
MKFHFALAGVVAVWSVLMPSLRAAEEAKPKKAEESEPEQRFSVAVKNLPRDWQKRVAAEKNRESKRIAELLAQCREAEYLESEDVEFLRRHRQEVIPKLRKAVAKDWRAGGAALQTWLDLWDAEARERWYAEFRKADRETRAELLRMNPRDEHLRSITHPRTPEEVAVFHEALKGPEFTAEAVFVLDDPNPVAAAIFEQLPQLPQNRQWEVVGALAERPLAAAHAARVLDWARERPLVEEDDLAQALELTGKIRTLGGETAEAAEKLFMELDAKGRRELLQPRSQHVAFAFCRVASAGSRPLMERLFREAPAEVRAAAFAGLARLRGPEILPELETLAEARESLIYAALEALAENGAREAADAWVLRTFPKLSERGMEYAANAGGAEVAKRALAQGEDLYSLEKFKIHWRANGITLPAFFERLRERGLIARVPTAEEIARARKERGTEPFDIMELVGLMHEVDGGQVVWWMTESQQAQYAAILHEVASITRGAFVPAAITQKELAEDGPEDHPEESAPIAIEFGAAGKLFQVRARGFGRLCDGEAVQAAANRVLEIAGKKERFLSMELGVERAALVYGPPEAWQQVAAEYGLPLQLITARPEVKAPAKKAAAKPRK